LKKVLVLLLLIVLIAGMVSAQEEHPNTAINVNIGPTIAGLLFGGFGIGGGLELALSEPLAFRINANYMSFSYSLFTVSSSFTYVSISPTIRVYPLSIAIEGLYIGGGAILYLFTSGASVGGSSSNGALFIPSIDFEFGYKTNISGFFIEPNLRYNILFVSDLNVAVGGLNYGFNIGYCF
jgi:hypothetical protein